MCILQLFLVIKGQSKIISYTKHQLFLHGNDTIVHYTSLLAVSSVLAQSPAAMAAQSPATTTPIKHVVVIFQENVSFDHYFGTYPKSVNRNV